MQLFQGAEDMEDPDFFFLEDDDDDENLGINFAAVF